MTNIEIIVETGEGLSNSNSYISLEDAEIYFSTRLNSGIWNDSEDEDKTIALIMATRGIDNYLKFDGIKYSDTQSLEFPRYSQKVNTFLNFSSIESIGDYLTFPKAKLEQATCELALHMLKDDVLIKNDLDGIKVLEITGSVKLETHEKKSESTLVPDYIFQILSEFCAMKAGSGMVKIRRG